MTSFAVIVDVDLQVACGQGYIAPGDIDWYSESMSLMVSSLKLRKLGPVCGAKLQAHY